MRKIVISALFIICGMVLNAQNCSLSLNSVSAPSDNGDGTCTYSISVTVLFSNDNGQASNSLTFSATNGTITSQTTFTGCNPCSGTYNLTVIADCGATITIIAEYDGPGNSDCITDPLNVPTTSLPAEFRDISISIIDDKITLSWETIYEMNNTGFEVERSLDGKSFEQIGFVFSTSTDGFGDRYHFVDKDELKNIVFYYRLKQIDFNGEFSYSDMVSLEFMSEHATGSIYPNPLLNDHPLTFYMHAQSTYRLFKLDGTLLFEGNIESDNQKMRFPGLHTGLYVLEIHQKGNQINREKLFIK